MKVYQVFYNIDPEITYCSPIYATEEEAQKFVSHGLDVIEPFVKKGLVIPLSFWWEIREWDIKNHFKKSDLSNSDKEDIINYCEHEMLWQKKN